MYIGQGYEWVTHQPFILTVMELYKPKFVLELGPGVHSTPVFLKYDIEFMCVENDKDWIKYLYDKYHVFPIYHDITGLEELHYNDLTLSEIWRIVVFYQNLNLPILKPNLLFVDQTASCRLLSITELKHKFDFIIYHDHDESGFLVNGYEKLNYEGFNAYVLSTPRTGSCLMIRKELDKGFDILKVNITPYIEKFKQDYPECDLMEINGLDTGTTV